MPSTLAWRSAETWTPALVKSAGVSAEHSALPDEGAIFSTVCPSASTHAIRAMEQTAIQEAMGCFIGKESLQPEVCCCVSGVRHQHSKTFIAPGHSRSGIMCL